MRAYIINLLLFFLPGSRFYLFKKFLIKLLGAKIGKNVRIMNIKIQGVKLFVGENTFIGNDTIFMGGKSNVKIGKNCDISSRVSFITGSHEIGSKSQAAGKGYSKDIIVGNGVWIGYGSTILPGIIIGDGCIIAAGSVVISDVPDYTLVAGCPAKIKKELFK